MRIVVFQHADVEHPGVFRDFLKEDGFTYQAVELDEGEPIPDLDPFDLMIVMGGPQDVWEEDTYPWLKPEKAAIRKFVADMRRPYLGICLGHQLLASALGGTVGPAATPEIGILNIARTGEGHDDPLMQGVANPMQVLQWHGAEVTAAPPQSSILASSDACGVQALRYGDHAYGIQFHVEITNDTVGEWAEIPAYAASLEKALGPGAVNRLASEVETLLPVFNRDARTLYDNFKAVLARRPVSTA